MTAGELRELLRGIPDDTEMEISFQPTVQAIPLNKVKKARKEIENLTPWDEDLVEMYDVLAIEKENKK